MVWMLRNLLFKRIRKSCVQMVFQFSAVAVFETEDPSAIHTPEVGLLEFEFTSKYNLLVMGCVMIKEDGVSRL